MKKDPINYIISIDDSLIAEFFLLVDLLRQTLFLPGNEAKDGRADSYKAGC